MLDRSIVQRPGEQATSTSQEESNRTLLNWAAHSVWQGGPNSEAERYSGEILKSIPLFIGNAAREAGPRGKVLSAIGYVGSAVAYALDQEKVGDFQQGQYTDFALGAAKGLGSKAILDHFGNKDWNFAAKGMTIGSGMRIVDNALTPDNYMTNGHFDLGQGIDNTVKKSLTWQGLAADTLTFGVGLGAAKLLPANLAANPLAHSFATNASFGFVSGGLGEYERQQSANESFSLNKILFRGAAEAGVMTVAGGIGHGVNARFGSAQVARTSESATDKVPADKSSGSSPFGRAFTAASLTVGLHEHAPGVASGGDPDLNRRVDGTAPADGSQSRRFGIEPINPADLARIDDAVAAQPAERQEEPLPGGTIVQRTETGDDGAPRSRNARRPDARPDQQGADAGDGNDGAPQSRNARRPDARPDQPDQRPEAAPRPDAHTDEAEHRTVTFNAYPDQVKAFERVSDLMSESAKEVNDPNRRRVSTPELEFLMFIHNYPKEMAAQHDSAEEAQKRVDRMKELVSEYAHELDGTKNQGVEKREEEPNDFSMVGRSLYKAAYEDQIKISPGTGPLVQKGMDLVFDTNNLRKELAQTTDTTEQWHLNKDIRQNLAAIKLFMVTEGKDIGDPMRMMTAKTGDRELFNMVDRAYNAFDVSASVPRELGPALYEGMKRTTELDVIATEWQNLQGNSEALNNGHELVAEKAKQVQEAADSLTTFARSEDGRKLEPEMLDFAEHAGGKFFRKKMEEYFYHGDDKPIYIDMNSDTKIFVKPEAFEETRALVKQAQAAELHPGSYPHLKDMVQQANPYAQNKLLEFAEKSGDVMLQHTVRDAVGNRGIDMSKEPFPAKAFVDYMTGRAQQTGDRIETYQSRIADAARSAELQAYLKAASPDLVTSSAAAQAIDGAIGTHFSDSFPRFNVRGDEPIVNGRPMSEAGKPVVEQGGAETEEPGPSEAEIRTNNTFTSDMLNGPTQTLQNKAANNILKRISRLDEEQFGYLVDWLNQPRSDNVRGANRDSAQIDVNGVLNSELVQKALARDPDRTFDVADLQKYLAIPQGGPPLPAWVADHAEGFLDRTGGKPLNFDTIEHLRRLYGNELPPVIGKLVEADQASQVARSKERGDKRPYSPRPPYDAETIDTRLNTLEKMFGANMPEASQKLMELGRQDARQLSDVIDIMKRNEYKSEVRELMQLTLPQAKDIVTVHTMLMQLQNVSASGGDRAAVPMQVARAAADQMMPENAEQAKRVREIIKHIGAGDQNARFEPKPDPKKPSRGPRPGATVPDVPWYKAPEEAAPEQAPPPAADTEHAEPETQPKPALPPALDELMSGLGRGPDSGDQGAGGTEDTGRPKPDATDKVADPNFKPNLYDIAILDAVLKEPLNEESIAKTLDEWTINNPDHVDGLERLINGELSQRLAELEAAGLVEKVPNSPYGQWQITSDGRGEAVGVRTNLQEFQLFDLDAMTLDPKEVVAQLTPTDWMIVDTLAKGGTSADSLFYSVETANLDTKGSVGEMLRGLLSEGVIEKMDGEYRLTRRGKDIVAERDKAASTPQQSPAALPTTSEATDADTTNKAANAKETEFAPQLADILKPEELAKGPQYDLQFHELVVERLLRSQDFHEMTREQIQEHMERIFGVDGARTQETLTFMRNEGLAEQLSGKWFLAPDWERIDPALREQRTRNLIAEEAERAKTIAQPDETDQGAKVETSELSREVADDLIRELSEGIEQANAEIRQAAAESQALHDAAPPVQAKSEEQILQEGQEIAERKAKDAVARKDEIVATAEQVKDFATMSDATRTVFEALSRDHLATTKTLIQELAKIGKANEFDSVVHDLTDVGLMERDGGGMFLQDGQLVQGPQRGSWRLTNVGEEVARPGRAEASLKLDLLSEDTRAVLRRMTPGQSFSKEQLVDMMRGTADANDYDGETEAARADLFRDHTTRVTEMVDSAFAELGLGSDNGLAIEKKGNLKLSAAGKDVWDVQNDDVVRYLARNHQRAVERLAERFPSTTPNPDRPVRELLRKPGT